jgi:hypothetical protein
LTIMALFIVSVCVTGCESDSETESDARRGTIIDQEERAAAADDTSSDSSEEGSSQEDPSENPYSLATTSEIIGTSDGLRAGFGGIMKKLPIKGSVRVAAGAERFTDDNGDGDAQSDIGHSSGFCTIDYLTREIVGQSTLAPTAGTSIVVTYQYLSGP